MSWKSWKRDTKDPLARYFLDECYLHLLSAPREGVSVGDLYGYDGQVVSGPGSIDYFLNPSLHVSPTKSNLEVAELSKKISDGISLNIGLDILDVLVRALGALSVNNIGRVKTNYQKKNVHNLRFAFNKVTKDYVDATILGNQIIERKINQENAFYIKNNKYYLVTGIYRSPSIRIISEDKKGQKVNVDTETIFSEHPAAEIGIDRSKSAEGQIEFKGNKSLAFAVELHEIFYDSEGKLRLQGVKRMVPVRAPTGIIEKEVMKPAFIGDPDKGFIFLPTPDVVGSC
jgi:hypothetical protein